MKRRIVVFIILIFTLLPVLSFARGEAHRTAAVKLPTPILPVATVIRPAEVKFFHHQKVCILGHCITETGTASSRV